MNNNNLKENAKQGARDADCANQQMDFAAVRQQKKSVSHYAKSDGNNGKMKTTTCQLGE